MFSASPGFQFRAKSSRILAEIEGRMLAKSAPRVLKSTRALARSTAPPAREARNVCSGEAEIRSAMLSIPVWCGSTMSRLPAK